MKKEVLAIVVSVSVLFCSCSLKNSSDLVITDDDTWYNTELSKINLVEDDLEEWNIDEFFYDKSNDKYKVVINEIHKASEEDMLDDDFVYEDLETKIYKEYDSSGKLIYDADIKATIDSKSPHSITLQAVNIEDDYLYILYAYYDVSYQNRKMSIAQYDVSKKVLVKDTDIDIDPEIVEQAYSKMMKSSDLFVAFSRWNKDRYIVFDSKGNSKVGSLSSDFDVEEFLYSGMNYCCDDNTLSFIVNNNAGKNESTIFCGDNSIRIINKTINSNGLIYTDYSTDGNLYGINSNSVKKYNSELSEFEKLIGFENANINLWDLQYCEVIHVDDEGMIIADLHSENSTKSVYKLTKSDKNPYVGRDKLKVAIIGYPMINKYYADAFFSYNNTYDDSLLCVEFFDVNQYVEQVTNASVMNKEKINIEAANLMVNDLLSQIQNGTGPDVIINGANILQLNSDTYLTDLNNLWDDKYNVFNNIIESSKNDDQLYQLPLSFNMLAIYTSYNIDTSSGIGFTFAEYKDFVDNKCNGFDAISFSYGQKEFLEDAISAMNKTLYDSNEHKWDFTCDDFRELCEYIKEMPRDSIASHEGSGEMEADCYYGDIYGLSHYGNIYFNSEGTPHFYGIPSSNGQGVTAKVADSIAITSCCKNKDSALNLINLLMSDDYQSRIENATPINKNALLKMSEISTWTDKRGREHQGADVIDSYIHIGENISSVYISDSMVLKIAYEELQPYFYNQKSFDDVIWNLKNRVDTYCTEIR